MCFYLKEWIIVLKLIVHVCLIESKKSTEPVLNIACGSLRQIEFPALMVKDGCCLGSF